MTKNFPNLGKRINIQVHEAQKIPNKMDPKIVTPKYIILKMAKVKERLLEAARQNQLITTNISAETLRPGRSGTINLKY